MNQFFKQLTILWLALMISPLMILVVFFVISQDIPPNIELQGIFEWIALAMFFLALLSTQAIYPILLKKAKDAENQDLKMQSYQSANIIKWVLLESSSLFTAVAYLLTQTQWLIALVLGMAFWMFLQRPTPEKYRNEVEM